MPSSYRKDLVTSISACCTAAAAGAGWTARMHARRTFALDVTLGHGAAERSLPNAGSRCYAPVSSLGEAAMGRKLYIGNLSFTATEDELRDFFAQAGTPESVAIIKDRLTGKSRGFGFVE